LSRATCRVCATFHPACELSNSNHHHRFLSSVSSRLPRTPNHFLADARYASRNPRGRPPRKNTSSCKLSPIRVNRSTQTARARFGRPCAAHLLGRLRSSKALGSTVRASRGFDVWPSAGPLSTISAETLPTTTPASITFLELHQRIVSLVREAAPARAEETLQNCLQVDSTQRKKPLRASRARPQRLLTASSWSTVRFRTRLRLDVCGDSQPERGSRLRCPADRG